MTKRVPSRKIRTTIKNQDLVEKRHNQIFEGARRLFAKKGYHVVGLRELSNEIGISLGNLYNYIKTKDDILYIIHQKAAEMVMQATKQKTNKVASPVTKLEKMMESELRTIDKYQDLILLIYQESHALRKASLHALLRSEEVHLQRFQKVLEEGMALGVFKSMNSIMLANIIKMMIDCWALKRWSLRGRVSLEVMKRGILGLVEKGIIN